MAYWENNKAGNLRAGKTKNKNSKIPVSSVPAKSSVSKSGYYDYIKRVPCKQKIRKAVLTLEIERILDESKQIYGAPKITKQLRNEGHAVSERYVGKIMRENVIKAHYQKKGCPYDNAVAKATYKIVKTEFVYNRIFDSFEEIELELFI